MLLTFFFYNFFTCSIYNIYNNRDINKIKTLHTQFDANLFTLARLGNCTGILLD